jgi:hypothetical protein
MEVAARKSGNCHAVVPRRPRGQPPNDPNDTEVNARKGRSRITNGSAFVLGDNRSPWIRRCKDIALAHSQDLGGDDAISEAQRSLIRRVAILTTQLEMLENKFAAANGQASASDLDLYIRASGNLRRILQTLGLERRSRDVTPPTLDQYLAFREQQGHQNDSD